MGGHSNTRKLFRVCNCRLLCLGTSERRAASRRLERLHQRGISTRESQRVRGSFEQHRFISRTTYYRAVPPCTGAYFTDASWPCKQRSDINNVARSKERIRDKA